MAASLYIGLISGTSANSIDACLVDFKDENSPKLLATHEHPISPELKQRITELYLPSDNEIDRMGLLDRELGLIFADAVHELLSATEYSAKDIEAIGSHGQTIRHRPADNQQPLSFTVQIGDPNTIASKTQIKTVADFRRKDLAYGGQGAPLAPALHNAILSSFEETRCIINIGGIANVTILSPNTDTVIGFDTGPGNALMDEWIELHKQEEYDADGQWASQGQVIHDLLTELLEAPYFKLPHPKSTGREEFHLPWLQSILKAERWQRLNPRDVQATLSELSAQSICESLNSMKADGNIYICGGGAHNTDLLNRIQRLRPERKVLTTEAIGIHPDWVEATAFAWLAMRTCKGMTGNLNSVTGASQKTILGGIYLP